MIRELQSQHALVPFSPKASRTQRPLHQCRCIKHLLLGSPLLITILPSDLLVLPAKQPHVPSEPIQLFAFCSKASVILDRKTFFLICLGTELNRETMTGMPEMLMLGPKSQLLFACPSIAKKWDQLKLH